MLSIQHPREIARPSGPWTAPRPTNISTTDSSLTQPCSDSAIGSVWLVTDLIMSQLEWQHKQKYASPWRSMKPENLQNSCARLSLWLYQGLCSIWRGCNFIRLTSFVEKKICNGIIKIEVQLSRLIYNGAFLKPVRRGMSLLCHKSLNQQYTFLIKHKDV